MLNKRPLVVYHGSCFDGFCAAWVFRSFMGKDCDFHPARYGEDPPDVKGRLVWILDFSYPREVMLDLIAQSKRTTIYDHHKTAEAALDNILQDLRDKRNVLRKDDKIVFDMNRSGAGITFDELEKAHGQRRGFHTPRYNGARSNWLVDYIEDRDLWKHALPNSETVAAWVATVPFTFLDYDNLLNDGLDAAVSQGKAVQKYIDIYGKKARAHARNELVGGYEVPTVNLPYMNCSEHVGALAQENPDFPFACGYFRRDDGRWQFSLRSRKNDDDLDEDQFDVSEVAKKYGGGGHEGAAGFDTAVLPWEEQQSRPQSSVIKIGDNEAEVEDYPPDEEVSFED